MTWGDPASRPLMHDPLIRGLASNEKVKSAATRGPGFSWPGSAPQAGVLSGFQYLTVPLSVLPETAHRAAQATADMVMKAARAVPGPRVGETSVTHIPATATASSFCQMGVPAAQSQ